MLNHKIIDFFTNIDASQAATSEAFEVRLTYDWAISIISTGLDAEPKIYIEGSTDDVNFVALNIEDGVNYVLIDDGHIMVIDDFFPMTRIRLRLDPDTNTQGTITATLKLKLN